VSGETLKKNLDAPGRLRYGALVTDLVDLSFVPGRLTEHPDILAAAVFPVVEGRCYSVRPQMLHMRQQLEGQCWATARLYGETRPGPPVVTAAVGEYRSICFNIAKNGHHVGAVALVTRKGAGVVKNLPRHIKSALRGITCAI